MSATATASPAPSGDQHRLCRGDDIAVVVEVGGGLRSWSRAGHDILAGYREDEMCSSGRGQLLIPWPNRIRDGRYTFAGTHRQLPLTEVPLSNASHGLLRWAPWSRDGHADPAGPGDSVTMRARLHPQPGWDWTLDVTTRYTLTQQGLVVTSSATNRSATAAPFGYGAHPYVAIGDVPLSEVSVTVPARTALTVDERMLPTGRVDVAGTDLDLRSERPLAARRLDTAFTDVLRDDTGVWRCQVASPGRPVVTVWGDEAFGWVQVFTGKAEADQAGQHGIAVEPMTCPADAFRSGDDLIALEPGQTWTGTWGIDVAIP